MIAALETEWSKFWRARVVQLATAALVIGVTVMCLSFSLAAARPGSAMAAKLGPLARNDWAGLFGGATEITATGGIIGFGVVLSWLFGREFTQGTIVGLFALPVSRTTIAAAKLLVFLGWVLTTSVALVASLLVAGFALGYGEVDFALAGKEFLIAVLSALLAVPAALVATASRGYIGAIGSLVGLIVVAQIGVASGLGGWLPLAAPGLWAAGAASVVDATAVVQLALVVPFAALFGALTILSWRRLQLT
jgi:ABC-2 type transport system permease protein